MRNKILCILCVGIISANAYADDRCLKYKITPRVDITVPEYTRVIEPQPLAPDNLHGNVESFLSNKLSIGVESIFVKDGFCVYIKSVESAIGFNRFIVHIDSRYKEDSCEYNAVLEHEDKHINAHLGVIDEYKKQINDAVYNAANSVMPVFVTRKSQIDSVVNDFYDEIQKHPEFVLILQQINTQSELRNNAVDDDEDGAQLQKCIDENWN